MVQDGLWCGNYLQVMRYHIENGAGWLWCANYLHVMWYFKRMVQDGLLCANYLQVMWYHIENGAGWSGVCLLPVCYVVLCREWCRMACGVLITCR